MNSMVTIHYQPDDSLFPNPERGWYWPYNPKCCGVDNPHAPFSEIETNSIRGTRALSDLRSMPEGVTLIRDMVLLGQFIDGPISQDYLTEIEANWALARQNGLKVVVRFLYDYSMENRDPDEAIINSHLDQLTPLLARNKDVIAWVQAGLYGGSGEANASDNGYVFDKYPASPDGPANYAGMVWQGLSDAGIRVYLKELGLIPQARMLALRYPRLKWDLLDLDFDNVHPLTEMTAFDGSAAARLGYYDDGYMGDEYHFAMFQFPGEMQFTRADTAYTVYEGELSVDDSAYALTPGQVVKEMAWYHQAALNIYATDALDTLKAWKPSGDYDEITRRMGYRFRLNWVKLPSSLHAQNAFTLEFNLTNDGFARPINPRKVEIILRSQSSGEQFVIEVDNGMDNRLWLPGPAETKTLTISLPASIPAGNYDILLNLPDPEPSLHDRPEYSIRLANKDVWEPTTGYNNLNARLTITGD